MSDMDLRVFIRWFLAVSFAQDGDLQRLIELLRSEMPQEASKRLAEQAGRSMLAELLERRPLAKKRGGQQKRLFNLTAKEAFARAAKLVQRMQDGQVTPITELLKNLPPEQLKRLRRGEAIGLTEAMLTTQPKRITRTEAINKVAELNGIDAQKLANYVDGKIGFGRKKRASGKQ
jgi:hypothetical protein